MIRLLTLLSVLAISNVFIWIDSRELVGFPFNDTKLTLDTYVYFLCEKLIVVMLALVIYESIEYKTAGAVFLFIAMADTLDYVLFYGNANIQGITWNAVKVGIFGLTILYEHARR